MQKDLFPSKQYNSKHFEKIICTSLGLAKFYPLVQKRLLVYGSMSSLSRTFDAFLLGEVSSPDPRWLFFKLMISFDLFGIIDVLFLSSQGLQDYIDRLYLPYHYTSLKSDGINFDDPEKIVDEIIEESFRQSRISYLLEVVIGLHLDIKQESLINLHFNEGRILRKYEMIEKHMQEIQTIILKKHLRQEDFNDEIQNDENRFLICYYNTTDTFKNSLEDLRLILEYEQLLYEFQEADNTQKNHKNINQDKIKETRIMKMLKIIQTIYNKFKEGDEVMATNYTSMKQSTSGKKKMWASKTKVTEVAKLDEEYEQLIKIFNKEYKSEPFEILELLKLNIIKYVFEKVKIRKCDLDLFKYLVKLKLFNSKISESLWTSLKDPTTSIVNFLNNNELDLGIDDDCPLFHYDKLFKQEQQLAQNFIKIQNIFKEVDLLIASQICGSWVETTQISNLNKVLVIGKTKAGKSSMLNFLSRNPGRMMVGETLTSKTFYPEYVNIRVDGESWEWWDLPGLLDTRSFIFRLCIGFFLKCIVNSSLNSKIKFILVSKNIDIFEVQSFSKMIKLFGNLFNWKQEGLESLSVVFTHIQNRQGIEDAYDQERQRVFKTDPEVFLQKIKPIKNVSDSAASEFYTRFRDQLFNTEEYFTRDDNKTPTKQSESRSLILNLVKSCEYVKEITVEPIIFLFDDESAFLQRFNIQYRAKQFLDPKREESNELFLKLFSIIQSFRSINTESIKNQYKIIKDKLRREYQSGIHDSFVKLNELNFEENRNKDSTTNIINKILKYHLKSYFASFEQKLRTFLDPYNISPQLVKIVIKKAEDYAYTRKINLESEVSTILQEVDADQVKQITARLLVEAERQNKIGIKSEEEEVDLLLSYLKYLVNYKEKEIISIMKEPHGSLEALEDSLLKTTLKEDYKAIFKQKDSNMKKKLNRFFKLRKGNYIETTLLQAVEELFSEGTKNSAFEPEVMVEHFLELLSKENYESNLRLDFRYNKLFPNDKIENILKSLRLDFYGQCIHNKEVVLSQFLKINTIEQRKKSPDDETVYVFSQYNFIKVYCTKFIFDIQNVNIKCKQSFCIVADEIEFKYQKHNIKAVKFNKEPATLVVIIQQQHEQFDMDYYARLIKTQNCMTLYSKPYREIDNDLEKIKYIQNHGTLVSRTCIEAATYLELFYYDPNFSFALTKDPDSQHRRHILKIKVAKNITGSRSLEFGELHLKRLVQSRIQKSRKGAENKSLTEQESVMLREICNKTVEFIKDKFEHTTIRLKYEHFNTIFCKKMAQHIFQMLKNNPRQDIKNITKSCYRMMKEQMFSHIYIGIINILESEYTKQYGRHYSSRKIQTESFQIKKYCESLIELPLHRFQKQNQEENLNSLTKKFKLRFQKNMFYFIQEKISLKNVLLGIYTYIVGIHETEEDKRDKLSYDPRYIQSQTQKLKKNQGFFVGEEKEKEKMVLKQSRMEDSFLGSDDGQIDESFKQNRQDSKLLCEKYRFSELIKVYETENTIFTGKQDEIHSYLGYAYMKKRRFREADAEFKLLPSENENSDKNKIIFDILKRKYNSIEEVLLMKQTTVDKSKRIENVQKETFEALKNPFKFETKQSRESRSSLTRYIERDREFFNILSFDSAKFNNHIVNILLAAEIEKCTHRPIMHMFDMIICKNSSALIGAALAIPMRTERDPTYGVKLYPQFSAFEFIKASHIMLNGLDEQMNIKTKFKPSDYDFRNLHTTLAIVAEDQKESSIITTFNYAETTTRNCRTIYDIVLKTVGKSKRQKQVDPLVETFNDKSIPALKSDRAVDVLSLGSGIYYHMNEREFNHKRDNKRINNFNRWQVLLEDEERMDQLRVEDYIELTRIMIEEKWINETKQMRDLMDRLEDRPSIKYLNKRKSR